MSPLDFATSGLPFFFLSLLLLLLLLPFIGRGLRWRHVGVYLVRPTHHNTLSLYSLYYYYRFFFLFTISLLLTMLLHCSSSPSLKDKPLFFFFCRFLRSVEDVIFYFFFFRSHSDIWDFSFRLLVFTTFFFPPFEEVSFSYCSWSSCLLGRVPVPYVTAHLLFLFNC